MTSEKINKVYNYASYQLDLVSEFVDVADTLSSGWVFRGQTDWEWPLTSSFERESARIGCRDRSSYESAVLRFIKQARDLTEPFSPKPSDPFSWLALLQHHGCFTRLVDFTESFYVALYFAVRGCPDTDAAVWCISTKTLDKRIAQICNESDSMVSEEETPRQLVNNSIEYFDRFKGNDTLAIMYAKPLELNKRLIAQQGLFLCPLNLDNSFMDNLTQGLGLTGTKEAPNQLHSLKDLKAESESGKAIKVLVPQSQHRNFLFHLRKMNLTDATLFPGLDGYARSLNYFALGLE